MTIIKRLRHLPMALTAMLLAAGPAPADPVTVAVASNFSHAMQSLGPAFERQSDFRLRLITGSTGKLYAQILNGVGADVFLAADEARPARLLDAGVGRPDSLFTYALGRLALWSRRDGFVDRNGQRLTDGGFRFLAIANPKLAPYGRAAREVLAAMGLSAREDFQIVTGENIAQTWQFVASGNAELGFVALSQLIDLPPAQAGSHWAVPATLHTPIRQQALRLSDDPGAVAFMTFLAGPDARRTINALGYALE